MIFAAGLGTRLKPLTDTVPKALIPVSGQPLLYHVIMKLKAAGVEEIIINVHHFAGLIKEYLHANSNFGLKISISDETSFLRDTGGGIRYAKSLLLANNADPASDFFIVHNVDIVSNLDLRSFELSTKAGSLATLLVSKRVTQRYFLFDDSMKLVGWTNVSTGEVKSPYVNIDPGSCRRFAFGGIHMISDSIFDVFDKIDSSPSEFPLYDRDGKVMAGSDVSFGEKFSIVDFYLRAAAKYDVFGNAPDGLRLIDVGKVDTLSQVESSGLV